MKRIMKASVIMITCLILVLIGCFTAVSFPKAADGEEQEHTHAFDDKNRCSCGAALFEAETADLTGSTSSDPNATNIGANEAASGGGLVNNWAVAGNEIVWRFSVNRAVSAPISLVMSPCESGTTFSSTLSMTVNGVEVSWESDAIRGIVGEQWHNYSDFNTNAVAFPKGDVEIVLKAKRAYNVNIDCIRIGFADTDGVFVGPYQTLDEENGHTHRFVNGVCACGDLLLEAEDGAFNGTPTYGNASFVFDQKVSHGGMCAGNWGSGDNNATWTFTLDEAKTARIGFRVAPCVNGWDIPTTSSAASRQAFIFKVNGESRVWADGSTLNAFDGSNWYNYGTIWTEAMALPAGENSIYLEAYDGASMNFDWFVVDFVSGTDEPDDPPAHTHSYTADEIVSGRCSCGAALLEAEDADLSECVPSAGNTANVGTGVESASGGGIIENFSVQGNKITWRFAIDRAATAPLTLRMSPCEGATTFSSALKVTVNGTEVVWEDENIRALVGQQWHNYSDFVTQPFDFSAGNVEITIENRRTYNVNLDCMTIGFGSDVVLGEYVHTHAFVGGKCSCGLYGFEAEAGEVTGTSSDPTGESMIGVRAESSGGGVGKKFRHRGEQNHLEVQSGERVR